MVQGVVLMSGLMIVMLNFVIDVLRLRRPTHPSFKIGQEACTMATITARAPYIGAVSRAAGEATASCSRSPPFLS